jgi:tetratricopeptide (TPR) repeat protein
MSNPDTEKPLERLSKYEKELELVKNSEDIFKISNAFLNLAKLCYEIKAPELGLKYVQEALEISKKNSDFPPPHEFYTLLGDFNFEQGLMNDSYDAYEKSNKIMPKNYSLELFAKNNAKMGKVSAVLDKNSKAIKHYKEAEKVFEKLGLNAERAKIYNRIGLVYLKKIGEDITTTLDKIGTYNWVGESRFKKAKENFERAIMILEQYDLQETENELYNTIKANLKGKFSDHWSYF